MIKGISEERSVYIDGEKLSTESSRELYDHAPDGGVLWGYSGSGPSQLALALLLHFGATENEALAWYQGFKQEVIAPLHDAQTGQPLNEFEMADSRVVDWLEARRLFAQELE